MKENHLRETPPMKGQTRGQLLPPAQPDTIEIFLPLKPSRFGGRKYLIAPNGATVPTASKTEAMHTMHRALGRAFLWRRELEEGQYEGIKDLGRKKGFGDDYVIRQLSLTLLSPNIIEAILNNELPKHVTLQELYRLTDLIWAEQEQRI